MRAIDAQTSRLVGNWSREDLRPRLLKDLWRVKGEYRGAKRRLFMRLIDTTEVVPLPFVVKSGQWPAMSLLQLCVFCFSVVEQREIGIGAFPVGQKILVGDAGVRLVTLLLVQTADLQLGDNEDQIRSAARF